jgi:cation:H+ antiporter
MESALYLLAGLICAAIGGELFVRGIVGIAVWARISAGIIGATFAAFATSSPELSVSVTSALAGTPQIALGDALGSNVVNIALILGIGLLIAPLHASRDTLKRDFPVALLVPALLGLLAMDGTLSRTDGGILLLIFVAWLGVMVREVRRQRSAAATVLAETSHRRAILESIVGLGLLVASGKLIVTGATGIATSYGIDPFVIGATMVAIGTSAPELATMVVSRLRGHDEVGLGTMLGSNIFNGLFIVGIAACIHPITISFSEAAAGLGFGLVSSAFVFPGATGRLDQRRGALLVGLYLAYIGVFLQDAMK